MAGLQVAHVEQKHVGRNEVHEYGSTVVVVHLLWHRVHVSSGGSGRGLDGGGCGLDGGGCGLRSNEIHEDGSTVVVVHLFGHRVHVSSGVVCAYIPMQLHTRIPTHISTHVHRTSYNLRRTLYDIRAYPHT